jgi:transcription elongation GreA/GreB family factor
MRREAPAIASRVPLPTRLCHVYTVFPMRVTKAQYDAAIRGEILLMSPYGQEALRARLEDLRIERLKLEGDLGYAAQDYPDLRENAIYGDLAMKIQLDIPRQIDDLRDMLTRAVIIDISPARIIGFGTRFIATIHQTKTTFLMAGPAEVAFAPDTNLQTISYVSPLGRAIWAARAGDTRHFEAGGHARTVEIDELLGPR